MNAKVSSIKGKTEAAGVTIGKNISAHVDGSILTLTIDLSKDFGASKTGRSTIIATSSGNVGIPGTDAKIGLNIYK